MATVVVIQGNKLTTHERDIFVWFLVGYPVLVLLTFSWLVSRHSAKLYAPQDFKDQSHWMALQQVGAAIVAAAEASRDGASLEPSSNGITDADIATKSKSVTKSKAKDANRR